MVLDVRTLQHYLIRARVMATRLSVSVNSVMKESGDLGRSERDRTAEIRNRTTTGSLYRHYEWASNV